MYPLLLLSLACNRSGFEAVAIRPIYGWVDGCNTVTVTGRGFGTDTTVTIGPSALTNLVFPESSSLDYGYMVSGTVPAVTDKGYQDVTVTTGGKSSVITGSGAYYYIECPRMGTVDTVSPTTELKAGTAISIYGCKLNAELITARIVDETGEPTGQDIPLTKVCGTGAASFDAPALDAGKYYLQLIDAEGTVVAGEICPPTDTADTASSCTDYPLSYGSTQ